jgi:hypothetical protein
MPDIKKNVKYVSEQNKILEQLLEILNFNGDLTFLLTDLSENTEIQHRIVGLSDDIRKYYPASSCIGLNHRECKRAYLSIIRFVLKHHGRELYSNDHAIKIGDKEYRKTKKYKIV